MSIKISVIVPVFNVENYIDNCIQSLVNQTYHNIEIILVNDGSTDNCGFLCDNYANKYKNIKVVHKNNGGLSDARNAGIEQANGDYLLFVDSDDYITYNAVECFIRFIENSKIIPEIIIGEYQQISYNDVNLNDNNSRESVIKWKGKGDEYLKRSLSDGSFVVTVWSKLYKKEFVVNNSLDFKKGIVHEDELFTMNALLKAKNVVVTNLCFYKYLVRFGSIMTGKKQIQNAISIYQIIHELASKYELISDTTLKNLLCNHSATIYYQALSKLNQYEVISNSLLDKQFLRNNSRSLKNKIRYLVMRIAFPLLKYFV